MKELEELLKQVNETDDYDELCKLREKLDSISNELGKIRKRVNKKTKKGDIERDKKKILDIITPLFNKYPEATFIAIGKRCCTDDDSGNCSWYTSSIGDFNIDTDFSKLSVKELTELYLDDLYKKDGERHTIYNDNEVDKFFEKLSELNCYYPDPNFEDEDNAYWDRPEKLFVVYPDASYGEVEIDDDFTELYRKNFGE